jgi:dTDP-4-amino-4,6-dideoxygalactose transaminase
MAAILCDIHPGDEVIIPSFTFVSTALAFVRQGATIVFADSYSDNPNIDAGEIEQLITPQTKVLVPVHYAGVACDMDKIMQLADKYNLLVVEDAAQAVDSFYDPHPPKGGLKCERADLKECDKTENTTTFLSTTSYSPLGVRGSLGSFGHFAAFSFHETKNIIAGEGGMLVVNDDRFIHRAEIIWEKGTNRAEFFRGEVNKYGWVDVGSSFLPSEVIAAFLCAQIENLEVIQAKRKYIWEAYYTGLTPLANKGCFAITQLPSYATNNAHMFYLTCNSLEERSLLITHLKSKEILSVFHYLSLHSSPYYASRHDGRSLPNSDRFADCLVRLPLFYELSETDTLSIITAINEYYA